MIRINLLPHREARRKQRREAFYAMLIAALITGGLIVAGVGVFFATQLANQTAVNEFIKKKNADLDVEIKEIATLTQEIDALKARQQAVEDLQSDRNQPVYLMDELVKQVPEGVYLRSFKQEAQRVIVNGYAQSNERVSEMLRNVGNNSPWLEKPELIEIRSATLGQGRDAKKVFEFTLSIGIKRPRDREKALAVMAGVTGPASGVPVVGGGANATAGTNVAPAASAAVPSPAAASQQSTSKKP